MGRVAIAGAGPTGACLALLLAERGVDVVLIEASRSFQRQFRGQALMPSGLDALRQMGLSDLLSTAVEELSPGIPTTALAAWEFWIEGKRLFRVAEPMEASGPPCTLVSQPEFLQAVVDRAQTCPRFEFVSGQAVKSLNWQGDRVTGLTLANGQAIAADLVIAADGRNSSLREAAQLVLKQPKKAIDVLWFSLPDAPVLRGENVFYAIVDQGNAFGLFRNAQGAAQLGWGLPDAGAIAWQAMDWQQTILQHSPPWLAEALTQYLTTHSSAFQHPRLFSVTVGIAPHWSRPGLLLLGDAAHPMSPIRAQGINMALRDSIVAANHLVPVLGGNGIDGDTTEISALSENPVCATKLDAALVAIQAERSPEILQAQALQAQELAQGEKLRRFPILRWGAKTFTPLVGLGVEQSWRHRQRQLRLGVVPVVLKV